MAERRKKPEDKKAAPAKGAKKEEAEKPRRRAAAKPADEETGGKVAGSPDFTEDEDESPALDPKNDVEDKGGRVTRVKRKPPIDDEVTEFLAKFDSETLISTGIEKAKKLKFFKFVNADSWAKNVKLAKKTPPGLLRMRLGNLLRGALRKSEKAE